MPGCMLQRYVGVLLEKAFQVPNKHQFVSKRLFDDSLVFESVFVSNIVLATFLEPCKKQVSLIKLPTLRASNNANVGNSEGFP